MFTPRNLCFSPLDNVILSKYSDTVTINIVFTSSSTCDILLLSTYHAIVNCLSLMVLFSMHLSYGFIRNPYDFRGFEYISYHISAYYMYPQKDFRRLRYSTFTPFSTNKFVLCSGFTSHMMSTNSPSIFIRMNLFWHVSVEVLPRDIKNCHVSSFMCINYEAGELSSQGNGWRG